MTRKTFGKLLGGVLFASVLSLSANAQLKLPQYTKTKLDNGVSVVLMPKNDVPLVTLMLLVKGGGESDPAQMAGLADITNDLLLRGTTNRTAEQLAAEIDFLGATIGTGSDTASNTVTLEVLSKDVTQGVEILADMARNANFDKDEVAKELARALDSAKSVKDNKQAALSRYATKFFYPQGHPYGVVADELTIGRIQRDNIVDYYQRMYVGSNATVIAVGAFDAKALQAAIAKSFGPMRKGQAYTWAKQGPIARKTAPSLLLVDDPQSTQTYFQIMQPGLDATSKDRVAVELVNTLFGGRFTSMLNDALRVNAGLTYGANSTVQERRLPGAVAISTFTATKTTVAAIDMALDVLKKLREKGIDEEQLASAKAYVKGGSPTKLLETNDQLAALLGGFEVTGQGREHIDSYFARIDAVTVADAKRVIDTYYRSDNLVFALLGQKSAIAAETAKYATSPVVVELSVPGVVINAAK